MASIRSKKYSIEDMQNLAKLRNGICLSPEYLGVVVKLSWQCSEGHKWDALPSHIVKGGWCRKCFVASMIGKTRYKKNKYSLEDLHRVANERGGICLATEYPGIDEPIDWRCSLGHQFSNTFSKINGKSKQWCKQCKLSDLKKATAIRLEETITHNGGTLQHIEGAGRISRVTVTCSAGHQWETKASTILNGSWCPECNKPIRNKNSYQTKYSLSDAHVLAESYGGHCRSARIDSSNSVLVWECKQGHCFKAKFSRVKQGQWCFECNTLQLTVGWLREYATIRLGKLISHDGKDATEAVRTHHYATYECADGHIWTARINGAVRGSWCKQCVHEEMRHGKNAKTTIRGNAVDIAKNKKAATRRSGIVKAVMKAISNAEIDTLDTPIFKQ